MTQHSQSGSCICQQCADWTVMPFQISDSLSLAGHPILLDRIPKTHTPCFPPSNQIVSKTIQELLVEYEEVQQSQSWPHQQICCIQVFSSNIDTSRTNNLNIKQIGPSNPRP